MVQSNYQFGTNPKKEDFFDNKRKKENKRKKLKVVEDLPRQKIEVSKEQKRAQFKMTVAVAGVFIMLVTISCRNSQIDKKFTQIQDQKKQLALLQKENEQLKVSIENSLNLNNVEKVAKEELGMQKLTGKQTVYITLPKKDYIESASEKVIINDQKNWFKDVTDFLFRY